MGSSYRHSDSDRCLINGVENVIYTHDLSGNLTFLNRAGETLFGYSCEEARGLNISKFVGSKLAAHLRDEFLRETSKQIGSVYEIEVVARNGRRVLLEVSMRVVSRKGHPAEIEGVAVPVDSAPKVVPKNSSANRNTQLAHS